MMGTSTPTGQTSCLDNLPSLADYLTFARLILLRGVQKLRDNPTDSTEMLPAGLAISDFHVDLALSQLLVVENDPGSSAESELSNKIIEVNDRLSVKRQDSHAVYQGYPTLFEFELFVSRFYIQNFLLVLIFQL